MSNVRVPLLVVFCSLASSGKRKRWFTIRYNQFNTKVSPEVNIKFAVKDYVYCVVNKFPLQLHTPINKMIHLPTRISKAFTGF
jgi:hypothetical protein